MVGGCPWGLVGVEILVAQCGRRGGSAEAVRDVIAPLDDYVIQSMGSGLAGLYGFPYRQF